MPHHQSEFTSDEVLHLSTPGWPKAESRGERGEGRGERLLSWLTTPHSGVRSSIIPACIPEGQML